MKSVSSHPQKTLTEPDKCYQHVTHNHFKAEKTSKLVKSLVKVSNNLFFHSFQRTNSISPRSESRPKSEATATSETVTAAPQNGRRPSSPISNGDSAAKKLKKDEVRFIIIVYYYIRRWVEFLLRPYTNFKAH